MRTTRLFLMAAAAAATPGLGQDSLPAEACRALTALADLTVVSSEMRKTIPEGVPHCYVKGFIAPGIRYHVQLPLAASWNGRFLHWGDGGKDGDLDFADRRVAQGYAAANSNMGHDAGSEPGASFGYNNRQAEIDFAYRAVHLTVRAAKTLVRAYYRKPPKYSYHEGCSQGGREGLMAAQRFPHDFDGIVAGAPVNYYQQLNASAVWFLQRVFRDKFAGAPAFDSDGDGRLDSINKLRLLAQAVLAKCDALDGVTDGVVSDPRGCPFDAPRDLEASMCKGDVNADGCFTRRQVQTIQDFYRGAHDSKGVRVYWGKAKGSEPMWTNFIPYPGNGYSPSAMGTSGDHLNYIFYETDPGVPPANLLDPTYKPDKRANPPEWAWWEFNLDDFTAGKANFMMSLMNATEAGLTRFLLQRNGKLLLYHGWCDPGPAPDGLIEYFQNVVKTTFAGKLEEAQERVRLFLAPGMGHCGGGPGPNQWDKLAPLVEWVENGKAPESIVATHSTNGKVDNERPLCPYPKQVAYTGPRGGENNPANWVAANFTCR